MGTKLFLSITTLVLAFAIMPLFNDILVEELIGPYLLDAQGWSSDDYRTAFWRIYPLIIGGYIFVILPIQILASGAVQKFRSGRQDDDEQ